MYFEKLIEKQHHKCQNKDIDRSQAMNPEDIGDQLTSPLAPPWGGGF